MFGNDCILPRTKTKISSTSSPSLIQKSKCKELDDSFKQHNNELNIIEKGYSEEPKEEAKKPSPSRVSNRVKEKVEKQKQKSKRISVKMTKRVHEINHYHELYFGTDEQMSNEKKMDMRLAIYSVAVDQFIVPGRCNLPLVTVLRELTFHQ